MTVPSSTTLAAGTVGLSASNAVWSVATDLPSSAVFPLVSSLIGLAAVAIKAYFESRSAAVENPLIREENRFLRKRVQDLEAELRTYTIRSAPSPPESSSE